MPRKNRIVGKWKFYPTILDLSPTSHWRKIPGYSHYSASLYGQIYSFVPKRNKILKENKTRAYRMVDLCENSIRKMQSVHRAVAKAWIPNIYNKPFINHKDNNPSNNWVYNIHWCTHAENQQYALKHGNRKSGGDMKNARPVVRLTVDGEFLGQYDCIANAAKETGIDRVTITSSCKRKYKNAWRHNFMYLEEYKKIS